MKVQVKTKKHARYEKGQPVVYQVGDVFEATEAEMKAFGDKLVAVSEDMTVPPEQPEDEFPVSMSRTIRNTRPPKKPKAAEAEKLPEEPTSPEAEKTPEDPAPSDV